MAVDYDYYESISQQIKTILGEFCSYIEDAGIDESFLDLSDKCEDVKEIALAIKQRIKSVTGLTCWTLSLLFCACTGVVFTDRPLQKDD